MLCAVPLYAAESEMVVRLETDAKMTPVKLFPFESDGTGLQIDYLKDLHKILQFDLSEGGAAVLQEQGVAHEIRPKISGRQLVVQLSSLGKKETKTLDNLYLTGYMADDRYVMHQVADAIHRLLFDVEGIASTRIIYALRSKDNGKDHSEIWEADYDGGNPRQITERSAGYSISPAFLPPKSNALAGSFFYVSYAHGIPKIFVATLKDGKGHKLSTISGNQLMPAVSKQRDKVAFICDVTGNPDLFLQDFSPEKGAQGKPRQIFTAPFATQSSPTFSPEGNRIAFVSSIGGSPRVYVMDIPAAGTPLKAIKPALITKICKDNTAPSWSPDGTKIAYCSLTNGIRQIWVYDFLSGLEKQLTQGPRNKENPCWAPDSLHLLYNTSDAKACELFLIHLKQPVPVQITSGPGEKRFPAWEPRI